MRRFVLRGLMAVCGLAIFASMVPARALVVAPPPPGPDRLKNVDAIVVGRIIAIEGKDIQAPMVAKGEKVTYRVAVISVTDPIKGAKEQKMIRLGFQPPPDANNQPGRIRRPFRSPVFEVGQDGMFFLTKHFQEGFYTAPMYYDFVASQNGNFSQEVKTVKLTLKLGKNLAEGLKSKDAEERLVVAGILIQQYRQPMGRVIKQEAIPAEESKLILKAILEGNWKDNQGNSNPWNLFNRLGLTDKDGWRFPQGNNLQQEDFHRAAKEWLGKNADTYRIQKFVSGPGGPIRPPIRQVPVDRDVKIQPIQVQPIQAQPIQVRPIRVQPIRQPIRVQPVPAPQVDPAVPQR